MNLCVRLLYVLYKCLLTVIMALLSPDIIRLLENVHGFIIYISLNHCLSLENKDIYVYMYIYIYIYGVIKEIVTIYINLCCFNITLLQDCMFVF
jgi:hypothetical protein